MDPPASGFNTGRARGRDGCSSLIRRRRNSAWAPCPGTRCSSPLFARGVSLNSKRKMKSPHGLSMQRLPSLARADDLGVLDEGPSFGAGPWGAAGDEPVRGMWQDMPRWQCGGSVSRPYSSLDRAAPVGGENSHERDQTGRESLDRERPGPPPRTALQIASTTTLCARSSCTS